MFRLFGFREPGKPVWDTPPRDPAPPAANAEVRTDPIERAVKEKSDIAAFLARVYRNQRC